MARYHHRETSATFQMNVTPGASSLGKLLGKAETNWARIGLSMLIHAAVVALASFVIWWQGGIDSTFVMVVVAIIYAVVILFPLPHCRDSLQFYENGIIYKGKPYLFQTTQATFTTTSGTGYFLAAKHLSLSGVPKALDVSYIKNAQEDFVRFYVSASFQQKV